MSVTKKIKELIRIAKSKSNKNEWYDYLDIDEKTIEEFSSKTGIDLRGYKHLIDVSGIKHILRKHGNVTHEKKIGQMPVSEGDLLKIREIIKNYDKMNASKKTKTKLDSIEYKKRIGDSNYTMIEEIRKGRKKLALKTLFKKPLKPKDKSG